MSKNLKNQNSLLGSGLLSQKKFACSHKPAKSSLPSIRILSRNSSGGTSDILGSKEAFFRKLRNTKVSEAKGLSPAIKQK